MTDERALLYTNVRWLCGRLIDRAGGDPFDLERPLTTPQLEPNEVWCLVDSIAGLIGFLEQGESVDPLATCPALERWRAQVLESRGRQPLELAAAWELTAFACESAGLSDAAASARTAARAAITGPRKVA